MFSIITDKKLILLLEKIIQENQYPLAFIRPSSVKEKISIVFYDKEKKEMDKCSFRLKQSGSKINFIVKSKLHNGYIEISESAFNDEIYNNFKVGILSNRFSKVSSKLPDGFLKQAAACFSDFANVRVNNKQFDKLCPTIFGMEFDLLNNHLVSIDALDAEKGIYLLVQKCDDAKSFGAIIDANQIKQFVTGYKKMIGEDETQQTTYKKVPEMLSKKTIPAPPPMTPPSPVEKNIPNKGKSRLTVTFEEKSKEKSEKTEKPSSRESKYLPSTSTESSSVTKGFK